MKSILARSKTFIDTLFQKAIMQLSRQDLDHKFFNIAHIGELLLSLLAQEPYAMYSYILYYNLPMYLYPWISCPKILDFLLAITLPSNLLFVTTDDMASLMWNYMRNSDFFTDLFDCVYEGKEVQEKRKLSLEYKPSKVPDLTKIIIGGEDGQGKRGGFSPSRASTAAYSAKGIMIEDIRFIAADIDLVKKYFKDSRTIAINDEENSSPNVNIIEPFAVRANKILQRAGTLDLLTNEDAIIHRMKANMPLNSKDKLIITSPRTLAQIEPFKSKYPKERIPFALYKKSPHTAAKKSILRVARGSVLFPHTSQRPKPTNYFGEINTSAFSSRDDNKLPHFRRGSTQLPPVDTLNISLQYPKKVKDTPNESRASERNHSLNLPRKELYNLNKSREVSQAKSQESSIIMAPELPPILMKNSTLALRQAYSQVAKPKAYSKTLFVPQLFVKENVFMLNKLYPTQQKFFTSNDIDIRIQSMVFPKDFTKNETFNRRVAEDDYEIAKHIEQSESNLLKKLGIVKKNLSCAFLVNTLMERNDFALFTSTLKVRRGLTVVFPTKVPPNSGGHRKQLNNLR